jgi:hypothetical protein
MLNNGAYFKNNPEKVLGEYFTHNPNTGKLLTDQFGNPRPEVRGTVQDLERIDVPTPKRYDHFIPVTASTPVLVQPKKKESRIKKAIQRSKDKPGEIKATQELKDTIIKYNQKVEYKDESGQTKHYTIIEEEIAVFVTYQVKQGLYDQDTINENAWGAFYRENPNWKEWVKKGLVAYDGRKYVPSSIYYSGNIYKNLRDMQENESAIVREIGDTAYGKQLSKMRSIVPKRLRISEDPREKLYLSPFDKIWEEINITELADGTEIENDLSIGSIFYQHYLQNLPEEDFIIDNKRTTAYEIYTYWVRKDNFPRGTDKARKAAVKRNTTIAGQKLFDQFLIDSLTRDDKNKIEQIWNSTRNNYQPIQYHRIPVGFSRLNSRFKGGTLSIRPAQREGVAFMNSRGTGIVAYDVGVGKTMTSILAIDDGFTKGLFKRPLVLVPQKVYKKWIEEIVGVVADKDIYETKNGKKKRIHKKGEVISEGILPNVKINDYDNLGKNFIKRAMDDNGIAYTVDEYSVTMVTYEGLSKIGFNAETEETLAQRLNEALSQGESGRAKALQSEKAQEYIDQALDNTELDIEEMGIDAIIVDEAHNFRNLFMDVKGDVGKDGKREQKNFFSQTKSKPSARALNLFMLNAYIQDKHNRRNTFGLTATPFTNRATEIYSMLSLYDYEGMKDFDCYNIAQFCTTFIDETMEDAWTAAGKFEPKAVIRGYNNLPTLQSMVYRSINYKTGEEANIQRPEKIVLPLTHDENGVPLSIDYIVDTKLRPSQLQATWLQEITDFASKDRKVRNGSKLAGFYEEDKKGNIPGQTLIALNASRAVTFSPYALNLGGTPQFDQGQVTPAQFVDNSPKIKYAVECIRSVVDYHKRQKTPISGQVIYTDRGRDWFGHIRQYLIENVGFSDKEVAVFHGGVTKGRRESIKEGFLDGKIKVIIGSSTLREGVDLQKHGSTGYVCYIDWNPTDVHQLFGRIWRFGNKFSHVRWVVPLIENSSDIFTWQKLSEKMSRLNSIWTKADGTKLFEESELNAEELKRGLINDSKKLAEFEIEEQIGSIKSELAIVTGKLTDLFGAERMLTEFSNLTSELENLAQEATTNPQVDYYTKQEQREKLMQMEFNTTDIKSIYRVVRAYAKLKGYYGYKLKSKVDQHIKIEKRLKRLEETVLAAFDLSAIDDLTPAIKKLESQKGQLSGRLEEVKSKDNLERLTQKYEQEKEAEEANSRSIEQRVAEFQRLNYLLDCQYGIHNCDIYGRVAYIESGEEIETIEQERPVIESSIYNMSDKLRKFMPPNQIKAVNEILSEENGENYAESVLKPLEEQVAAIPKRRQGKSNPIVHAHFFLGGTDWYITEWNGKDDLFGYVILNGDVQMSELASISLSELHGVGANMNVVMGTNLFQTKVSPELDFFWELKPLDQVLFEYDPEYFPPPRDDDGALRSTSQLAQINVSENNLEPWSMTQDEFWAKVKEPGFTTLIPNKRMTGWLTATTKISHSWGSKGQVVFDKGEYKDPFNNHKDIVKLALKQGKDVPTIVLEEYGLADKEKIVSKSAPEMTIKMAKGDLKELGLVAKIATAINGLQTLAKIKKDSAVKGKIDAAIKGLQTLQKIKKAA